MQPHPLLQGDYLHIHSVDNQLHVCGNSWYTYNINLYCCIELMITHLQLDIRDCILVSVPTLPYNIIHMHGP